MASGCPLTHSEYVLGTPRPPRLHTLRATLVLFQRDEMPAVGAGDGRRSGRFTPVAKSLRINAERQVSQRQLGWSETRIAPSITGTVNYLDVPFTIHAAPTNGDDVISFNSLPWQNRLAAKRASCASDRLRCTISHSASPSSASRSPDTVSTSYLGHSTPNVGQGARA